MKPCGSSTMTNAIPRSARKRIVRSAFFSLSQDPLRNSTAHCQPSSRSTASSIVARFSDDGKTQRGYWSRIEPSWPRSASGARPVAEHRPDGVLELGRAGPWRRSAAWPGASSGSSSRITFGQPLRLGALAGHQGVGLDVEREVGRRPVDPQLGRSAAPAARSTSRRPRRAGTSRRSSGAAPRRCRRRAGRTRPARSSSGRSTTPCRSGPCRHRATSMGSAAAAATSRRAGVRRVGARVVAGRHPRHGSRYPCH